MIGKLDVRRICWYSNFWQNSSLGKILIFLTKSISLKSIFVIRKGIVMECINKLSTEKLNPNSLNIESKNTRYIKMY